MSPDGLWYRIQREEGTQVGVRKESQIGLECKKVIRLERVLDADVAPRILITINPVADSHRDDNDVIWTWLLHYPNGYVETHTVDVQSPKVWFYLDKLMFVVLVGGLAVPYPKEPPGSGKC